MQAESPMAEPARTTADTFANERLSSIFFMIRPFAPGCRSPRAANLAYRFSRVVSVPSTSTGSSTGLPPKRLRTDFHAFSNHGITRERMGFHA